MMSYCFKGLGLLLVLVSISCSRLERVEEGDAHTPWVISMEFDAKDNPVQLIEDVKCTIEGDSVITCWIPHIVDNKCLIPRYVIDGECAVETKWGGGTKWKNKS